MSANQSSEGETLPIINIVGEKVALGPLSRDLIPLYQRWINDFDVMCSFGALRPTTREKQEGWYERASGDDTSVRFTIYQRATTRPIGWAELSQLDYKLRTGEFGILIGEKDCWNHGCGTETATLMLDYGFNGLGLHNILLKAGSFNERGLRAYRQAGFKEIGRRRQAWRIGGQAYDIVYMDCLSTEFESRVMRQYLPQ